MMTADNVDSGREAFLRRKWADAYTLLSQADGREPLAAEDLERLATAAYLTARDAESTEVWTRAHQAFLQAGSIERAARCAFWLATGLAHRGERARAEAWLARARELLENHDGCVEQGYLLLPVALRRALSGDAAGAYGMFCDAAAIADRFGDPDLVALARHSRGRVLIRMGEVREGVRLLDQAILAVDAGEVSSLVVGDVYCSVIEGCLEIFDLRRAQEWTAAMTRWCESQPDLAVYRGHCLVRRAEVLRLRGTWGEALTAAKQACGRAASSRNPSGAAYYQCGELHRVRGDFAKADEAYREASRHGTSPQPGLALLRLAQGETDAAAAAIRVALGEAHTPERRTGLLAASAEIMRAAGDIPSATSAAEELEDRARALDTPALHALAAHARGAVLLESDARNALRVLRQAWSAWQDVGALYEGARVRVLIGLACSTLGDAEAAEMEFDAARWIFQRLGARPDLKRLASMSRRKRADSAGGLTRRQLDVLRHVASGKTNRQIADALTISERTVERHLSNIFNRLDIPSRAAATAWAYENELV